MTEIQVSAANVQAQIRRLEHKRGDLWSVAGGSKMAANLYRAFVEGRRKPSDVSLARAQFQGYDLIEHYRSLMAQKLTASAIAQAQAKCLTDEIRRLRANRLSVIEG